MKLLRNILFLTIFAQPSLLKADNCPVGPILFRDIGYGSAAGGLFGGLYLLTRDDVEGKDILPDLAKGAIIGGLIGGIIGGIEVASCHGALAQKEGFQIPQPILLATQEGDFGAGIRFKWIL